MTKANALPDFEDPLAACDAWKLQYTARKEAEKKAAALAIENKQKQQIIVEQEFLHNELMETFSSDSDRRKNSYSMNEFAKIVGCNPIRMNNFLRNEGVFMKKFTNRLIPMQVHANKFETVTSEYKEGNARIKYSCVDWLYEFLLKRVLQTRASRPSNMNRSQRNIYPRFLKLSIT